MKNRILLLIFLSLSSIFASNQSVPQKPTDTPKDKPIRVKVSNGNIYCYSPYITKGDGYVYISNCRYATPARYDVFQRVSWKVNDKWLCMTAPASVTGILGTSTQKWDYLRLRPCDINDPNQRWIIKDNSFYTSDGRFKIKDYGWWGYISKNPKDYYDHTIDMSNMQEWINTIATPGTITMHTPIGWIFVSPTRFAVYYLQNNASYADEIKELYYNPDNGHIFQYYPDSGSMYCLTSYHSKSQDWNWTGWEDCNDNIPKNKDNKYWEFALLNNNEGALRDKDGNFLRVTQYGPNWGVPYTVKPSYMPKDMTNAPKSIFLFDPYIDKWNRYVDSNLSDSLQYCPAPGNNKTLLTSSGNKRTIRSLPPTFRVTDEWIKRFWQIGATTNPNDTQRLGICGPCIIQSYQIMAELQEFHNIAPIASGGYFFDTSPNTNTSPFISFRQRFPYLAERIEGTMFLGPMTRLAGGDINDSERRLFYTTTLLMLPNYNFYMSPTAYAEIGIRNAIRDLFNRPIGTMWIYGATRTSVDRTRNTGHSQVILRVPEGLMFIPTNVVGFSLEEYRGLLRSATVSDESQAMNIITDDRTRAVLRFFTMELLGPQRDPLNIYISNNNCTGLGDDRRGNLQLPLSTTINQCASGRCGM